MTTKAALKRIDWFKQRGYLLGQRRDKGIFKFYIVNGMGEEREFDTLWQAQQFVERIGAYRRDTETPMANRA